MEVHDIYKIRKAETNRDKGGPGRLERLWRPVEVHDIYRIRSAEINGGRGGLRRLEGL